MNKTTRSRTNTRLLPRFVITMLVIVALGLLVTLALHGAASSRNLDDVVPEKLFDMESEVKHRLENRGAPGHPPGDGGEVPPEADAAVSEADGLLPYGVTVFEVALPGVANLDPDVLHALRTAATDASIIGIDIYVTSGWRSPAYQDQLLRDATIEYGSREEAARWVATSETSAHVSGEAVDIGDADAMTWLAENGADYGLCQTYENEPWHFELRPDATDLGCPPMYADPTYDPRMQQ